MDSNSSTKIKRKPQPNGVKDMKTNLNALKGERERERERERTKTFC
jgi:hypothetical protein